MTDKRTVVQNSKNLNSSSKLIEERLQECEARYLPGEGPLSIWVNHGREIFDELTSRKGKI